MHRTRERLWVWLVSALGISALVLTVTWMMLKSDTVPDAKASFMAMTQALSPARASASKCWSERRVVGLDCDDVKDRMPTPPSSDVAYLVTAQGVLIGIDYSNRVIVVLTPRVDGNELKWHCAGSPPEALTKLCSASFAAN